MRSKKASLCKPGKEVRAYRMRTTATCAKELFRASSIQKSDRGRSIPVYPILRGSRIALVLQNNIQSRLLQHRRDRSHNPGLPPLPSGQKEREADDNAVNGTLADEPLDMPHERVEAIVPERIERDGDADGVIEERDTRPAGADVESERAHVRSLTKGASPILIFSAPRSSRE